MEITNLEKYDSLLPVIILHDVVAFPGCSLDFDILGEESEAAVNYAMKNGGEVLLVTENSTNEGTTELYTVGVTAKIVQHMKADNKINRIAVDCLERVRLQDVSALEGTTDCIGAKVEEYPYSDENDEDRESAIEAAVRNVKGAFIEWSKLANLSRETIKLCRNEKNPIRLVSRIVYCGIFKVEDEQQILEESTIEQTLVTMHELILYEVHVLGLQKTLATQAELNFEMDRRDTLIREQINILSSQIQGGPEESDQDYDYISKIKKLRLAKEDETHLLREAKNLAKLPPFSQEAYVARNYLDTVLSLPWNDRGKATIPDIETAQYILDRDHYGLKKVKERVIEAISVQKMTNGKTSNIICLVGPPGTGKTSIAKSIAEASDRKYVRVSLGGVRDEADIRGHRKTYLGSMPGRIVDALIKCKSSHPLMLLDEIDKMSNDFRGDPASAMLEVLDSEQNKTFRDHYIEVPFDLSDVMFVATANDLSSVPAPLLDRMEIIELSSYTREEKFQIAKKHLVDKQIKKHGLNKTKFKISDDALYDIIDYYTKEAGVRELERVIVSLCRKADKIIVSGEAKSLRVSAKKLESLLGVKKYLQDERLHKDSVGTVNGLAWTAVGGVLMPMEAVVLKGKGRIKLTGSLGDVMKESAELAISYARQSATKYGIAEDFIENSDIHIHAPEGAVPKDGPSAGVTMTTAVISALSGIKVKNDVAMTGEISLHGDVLPIGGLREKTMAAYKAGISTIIVPYKNKPNMEEVDETVKSNVDFVFAKHIEDVLSVALVKKQEKLNAVE